MVIIGSAATIPHEDRTYQRYHFKYMVVDDGPSWHIMFNLKLLPIHTFAYCQVDCLRSPSPTRETTQASHVRLHESESHLITYQD
jgi:hypothetical protein